MTRPIKFRAWDKKNKRWFEWDDGTFRFGHENIAFEHVYGNPDFTLVQFTGLHDKNGKEIYEGDVVLGKPVIFEEGCFWIDKHPSYEWALPYLEVIGNIYENPELIK